MNSSKYKIWNIMRGSRNFCQRGSNSDKFVFCLFCFFEGSEAPKITISGQLSAYIIQVKFSHYGQTGVLGSFHDS